MTSELELTLVMPCLNEAETLATCIEKATSFLAGSGIAGEVVIGDNGSTDGSQKIARDLGARVIDVPVRGYGAALYAACTAARGRYIVMGDSDDSYDFSDLTQFVEKLREGDDLVMGNRFKGEIKPGAMPWKNRYIGNPVLSRIGQMLFPSPLGDFHCGIRGFSKDAFIRMDLRTTGMEFASEMVIKATQMKMRLGEVPTTLSPDGRSRPPHLRPYRDGWRHLRFMLLFSPNWIFFYPGLLLMIVSLVLGTLLVRGPLEIFGHELNVNTLIYCAFSLLISFQAVMFSLLSRIYAVQENLYPINDFYKFIFRAIKLESGLLVGLGLLLAGLGAAGYTVRSWRQNGFGAMDLAHTSRIVVPAATSIALGIEIMLFSFFLSTLGLSVRHYTITPAEESDSKMN
jgi:glycosyltransferase involved in cell wall biosynthesis